MPRPGCSSKKPRSAQDVALKAHSGEVVEVECEIESNGDASYEPMLRMPVIKKHRPRKAQKARKARTE
jgi:hypothetical protein